MRLGVFAHLTAVDVQLEVLSHVTALDGHRVDNARFEGLLVSNHYVDIAHPASRRVATRC